MARPKKPKLTPDEAAKVAEAIGADFGEISETDLPPDVMNVLEELGADVARVVLYRRLAGEKQSYVGTLDADEFSLDAVARQWGGGRYLARMTKVGGGFIKGFTFYIDENLKPERKDAPGAGGSTTETLLLKLLDRDRGPQKDPMEIAAALSQAAASQAQATIAAMTAAITPLLGQITAMAAGRKETPIADLVTAIQLGADLGGKGGPENEYLQIAEKVGVPLIHALETALTQQRTGTRVPLAVLPAGSPTGVSPAPNPGPSGPPWVTAIAPYIPKLVDFAAHAGEPQAIAAILDATYPRIARWLDEAVTHPQFLAELLTHFPSLVPHRAWVEQLLAQFGPEEEVSGEGQEESDKEE